MPPQSSSKKGIFIGIAVVLFGGLCVAAIVAGKAAKDKERATYGALKTVCSGQGVAAARMYSPTVPPHRVVGIARTTAGGEWDVQNSLIPSGRRATDVAGTDIVACFEPVIEQNVGTCEVWRTRNGLRVPGTTRNVPQFQIFRPVRLVSAQTGVLLNQTTLVGGAPPSCSGGGSSFRGSSPGDAEVNAYLAPLLDR